jgi:Protein of unknown function, DUF547
MSHDGARAAQLGLPARAGCLCWFPAQFWLQRGLQGRSACSSRFAWPRRLAAPHCGFRHRCDCCTRELACHQKRCKIFELFLISSRYFAERVAFFINIYNALIIHGTCAFGSPASLLKRLTFFGDVKYRIGADTYSADDIEHGVLRGNAASPASLGSLLNIGPLKKPQFRDRDLRRAQCVEPIDPRIHFALVCGAKSCPPIKLYTPDNLHEGLQARPRTSTAAMGAH